jgi:hypothetical protein
MLPPHDLVVQGHFCQYSWYSIPNKYNLDVAMIHIGCAPEMEEEERDLSKAQPQDRS